MQKQTEACLVAPDKSTKPDKFLVVTAHSNTDTYLDG